MLCRVKTGRYNIVSKGQLAVYHCPAVPADLDEDSIDDRGWAVMSWWMAGLSQKAKSSVLVWISRRWGFSFSSSWRLQEGVQGTQKISLNLCRGMIKLRASQWQEQESVSDLPSQYLIISMSMTCINTWLFCIVYYDYTDVIQNSCWRYDKKGQKASQQCYTKKQLHKP